MNIHKFQKIEELAEDFKSSEKERDRFWINYLARVQLKPAEYKVYEEMIRGEFV